MTLNKRLLILAEVLAFVAFALFSKALVGLLVWRFAGPITLIFTLIVLTVYMKWRGLSWRDFGLVSLPSAKDKLIILPKALLVFGAFAVTVGSILGLSEVLDLEFMKQVDDGVAARFGAVEGNLPVYLMWLGIVWTSAAFGEEMFFRGYLVGRMRMAFEGSKLAPVIAVGFAAAVFGYGHMDYQGVRGLIVTGAIGIAFGTMYLLMKRNLWPIILTHGVIDTLSFTGLYLGGE